MDNVNRRRRSGARAARENSQVSADPTTTIMERFTEALEAITNRGAPPPPAPAHDQSLERFLKFGQPKFAGEPDPITAEAWLEGLENIYAVLHYGDVQKVDLAVFMFEGAARHWWNSVEATWKERGIPRTWENFQKEFDKKYVPRIIKEGRQDEFDNLEQGLMSVAKYDAEFSRLVKYAQHFKNDERSKVRKFLKGLNEELQHAMFGMEIPTYSMAV